VKREDKMQLLHEQGVKREQDRIDSLMKIKKEDKIYEMKKKEKQEVQIQVKQMREQLMIKK